MKKSTAVIIAFVLLAGFAGCGKRTLDAVPGHAAGGYLFGRNFDWNTCDALVVTAYPQEGYASVSTVNRDFIRQGAGPAGGLLSDEMLTLAPLYAPPWTV